MRNSATPTRVVIAIVAAISAAVSLGGCVQASRGVIPTSEPSVTPVFASNAEALAAAEKAFTGYLAASDSIGSDGGHDPQRIADWVTTDRLPEEIDVFNKFAKTGNRLVGSSKYLNFTLQQLTQSAGRKVTVIAYVCDDVSGSRLLNAAGQDVTPSGRQEIVPLQVQFNNAVSGSNKMLIQESEPWSGSDFC